MLILDTTTRTLEVLLGGAVTTNQLPVVTNYVDVTTTTYSPASDNTVTNDTTPVTIVAAPGASTQRQVKFLSVFNGDTVAATVTIRLNDNGTFRTLCKVALLVGDQLFYTDGDGWRVMDANGSSRQSSVSVADGDKGDITVSSSGTVWTIDNDAVTYAKIQNVSATDKLLGRSTAGAGDVEEIACTAAARSILDDTTVGAILDTLGGATRTGTGGVVCLIAPTLTNPSETVQALTSGTTIAWNMASGGAATLTLATNATLDAPSNLRNGASYSLTVTQDGTGSRTLAYNSVFKFPGGTDPVLSTAAGSIDILTFLSDGTNLYGSILKAFS